MVGEVESPIAEVPIMHSHVSKPAFVQDCESLWVRVHRICDQYMPEFCDLRVGPKLWRALGDPSGR